MKEFLEFILRSLLEFPEEALLAKTETPRKVTFTLRLRPSDVGKIIGRHGHTIQAIRNLLNAAAARHGQRAYLEIDESR